VIPNSAPPAPMTTPASGYIPAAPLLVRLYSSVSVHTPPGEEGTQLIDRAAAGQISNEPFAGAGPSKMRGSCQYSVAADRHAGRRVHPVGSTLKGVQDSLGPRASGR